VDCQVGSAHKTHIRERRMLQLSVRSVHRCISSSSWKKAARIGESSEFTVRHCTRDSTGTQEGRAAELMAALDCRADPLQSPDLKITSLRRRMR